MAPECAKLKHSTNSTKRGSGNAQRAIGYASYCRGGPDGVRCGGSEEGDFAFQWHRHSCLCASAEARIRRLRVPMASRATKILIANPRLKFNLSYGKESLLKISNRERIAIFHSHSHARSRKGAYAGREGIHPRNVIGHVFLCAVSPAQVFSRLISSSAIRNPSSSMKKSYLAISNRR
jgi:hypothetical protein